MKNWTKSVALFLLGWFLLGWLASCAATYEQHDSVEPSAVLDPARGVAVVVPADGTYEEKTYAGSGAKTATCLAAAFARHAASAREVRLNPGQSLNDAAHQASADYVAVPTITHWEDRATEWSGRRDHVTVQVVVYLLDQAAPLASVELSGTSKWMTFGGDHPEELLPKPMADFVARLYGRE